MKPITLTTPKNMRIHFQPILCALTTLVFAFLPARLTAQSSGGMDIWPQNNTVDINGTKQFGAYVPLTPNTITWLVN